MTVREELEAFEKGALTRRFGVEEFLEFEKRSLRRRHEFVDGWVFPVPDDTRAANTICGNLLTAIKRKRLRVYAETVHLRIRGLNILYYPDIAVTIDPADNDPFFVDHPVLICEVMSPFTGGVDRREKRFNYTQIASLQEYVLVSQDTRRVEVLRREADWLAEVVEDTGSVEFRSIGLNLPIELIYEDIVP